MIDQAKSPCTAGGYPGLEAIQLDQETRPKINGLSHCSTLKMTKWTLSNGACAVASEYIDCVGWVAPQPGPTYALHNLRIARIVHWIIREHTGRHFVLLTAHTNINQQIFFNSLDVVVNSKF